MKNTRNLWRVVTLALALVMLFSVVACGNTEEPAATTEADGTTTAAPSTTQKPATTEKPTTATTEKPTTATTEKPTTAPTTEGTGTTGGTDDPVTPPAEDLSQPDVWDGTVDTSWFDITNIQPEYTLTTAAQFAGFFKLRQDGYNKVLQADRYYFEGVTIKLARDVVLNEGSAAQIKELMALGQAKQVEALNSNASFKGTFDGQGHTVYGVFLDCTSSGVKGLFGGLGDNAVVKNFTIQSAYYNAAEKDKHTGGILAARANGQNILVSNITVNDALIEESTALFSGVGILIGKVDAGKSITIENCHTSGIINFPTQGTNNYGFGGIVGYMESGAEETLAEDGTVVPATTTVLIMKNCTSSAEITATNIVGGLLGKVGDRYELKMDHKCKFTGTLSATTPSAEGETWVGDYVSNIEGFQPTQPVIIPELGVEDFSALKFPEFENAIVIEGASCEAGSVVMTNTEGSKYHIFNKDNNAGAAAHGVYKLLNKDLFHYYIDLANVNKTIEKEYGAEYKIDSTADCYIRWTFTVTEAGTYTFGSYMRLKNSSDRSCQIQIDGNTPIIMHYTVSDDEVKSVQDSTEGAYLLWDGVEVELEAGEHTITYSIPDKAYCNTEASWHWRTIYVMKKAA